MIISISGLIGSGKDTIGDYLVNKHGFYRESWAGTLKDAVAHVFGWDRTLLEGKTPEARVWREQVDTWWAKRLDMPNVTPRWVLQYWGTEVCRHGFHDEIWVASLENKLRKTTSDVVITDSRFSNEINAVKRAGGTAIRVVRGVDPDWVSLCKSDFNLFRKTYSQIHASEYSSVNLEYDYIIDNNHSMDHLYSTINDLLQSLRSSK
jgi:hypothetical protein